MNRKLSIKKKSLKQTKQQKLKYLFRPTKKKYIYRIGYFNFQHQTKQQQQKKDSIAL